MKNAVVSFRSFTFFFFNSVKEKKSLLKESNSWISKPKLPLCHTFRRWDSQYLLF